MFVIGNYERLNYTAVFRHIKKGKYIKTDIGLYFIQILPIFLCGNVRHMYQHIDDFSNIDYFTASKAKNCINNIWVLYVYQKKKATRWWMESNCESSNRTNCAIRNELFFHET